MSLFMSKVSAAYQVSAAYKIEPLSKEEYQTLMWLSDRGYDAGIFELASGEETDDGGYKFEDIPEHVAWQIKDKYDEDEGAFLTSNGSRSLSEKLYGFLDGIV